MQPLLALAGELGVVVSVARLPGDLLGCWVPELRRVFLDARLTPSEQRFVLAHELGHVHHGHLCGEDLPRDRQRRQEHQADVYAVRLLIDPAEYAEIEAVHPDKHEIADELGVTVDAVRVYEEACLTRLQGITYTDARDGLGQWNYRALSA